MTGRHVLVVTVLAALALSGLAFGGGPLVIKQRDSGRTFTVRLGGEARLRLSHRWTWTEPRVGGGAIRLVRIEFFRDPGYDEWEIHTVRLGTATIAAAGMPSCAPCMLAPRRFRVTIVVR